MSAPYQSYPPSLWAPPDPVDDGRGTAADGETFTDPAITASDAANAAKLTGLGFIADPQTAWIFGAYMTVNTFQFHWTGTAWASGSVSEPEPEPEDEPVEPESTPEAPESTPEPDDGSESYTEPTEAT